MPPGVPLFNPNRYSLRSERLKGDVSLFSDIAFSFDGLGRVARSEWG